MVMLPGGMEQRPDAGEGGGGERKRVCDVHATLRSIQRHARSGLVLPGCVYP